MFGATGVWGGGERYALELARAVAKRASTRLLTFGSERSRMVLNDLRIHAIKSRRIEWRDSFLNPL